MSSTETAKADKVSNPIEQPALGAPEATQSRVETAESVPSAGAEHSASAEHLSETVPSSQTSISSAIPAPALTSTKETLTQEIEDVLSEDLGDLYKSLSADKQRQFKAEGERTAGVISQLFSHGKFHARRISSLVKRWLRLIPGVNRFFLEQEAKIKTDKLLQMAEEKNKNDI